MNQSKIKVSVAKLLELVREKAASDAVQYEGQLQEYGYQLGVWGNQTRHAITRLQYMDDEELARRVNAGTYNLREQLGFEQPPVRPTKPDHTSAIRQLELAADEFILLEPHGSFGRYLA